MRGQVQENKPEDKPDIGEVDKKGVGDAVDSWNEWAAQRPEKGLSPEERAERQKIERFPDTIGRRFNELPTIPDVRAYYDQLSQADKDALNNPDTKVTLECYASHTGDAGYNKELTRKSGEAARSILQKEFGVKADIRIKAHGYDQDLPEGDDSFDRQVQVDIQPGLGEQSWHQPEKGLSPEERPEREKVADLPGFIGRGFNEIPNFQNVRTFYDQLNQADKDAMNNPDTKVTLTCYASHTGSAEYNRELTRKSGEVVKDILQKDFGVKADIKIEARGYNTDTAEGDYQFDRVVDVDILRPIEEKTSQDQIETPLTLDKDVHERLKDIPESRRGNIEKTVLEEIGKLSKGYLEEAPESKQASVRVAELSGIAGVLNIVQYELLNGQSDHIQKGMPFSVQELKGRMNSDDRRQIMADMELCKTGNRASDQDLERGYGKAVDGLNRVLSQARNPQERLTALRSFFSIHVPLLTIHNQRLGEIRDQIRTRAQVEKLS